MLFAYHSVLLCYIHRKNFEPWEDGNWLRQINVWWYCCYLTFLFVNTSISAFRCVLLKVALSQNRWIMNGLNVVRVLVFWCCFHAFAQGHKSFTITNTSCANITSVDIKLHSALAANAFTWSEKGWFLHHHLILFLGTYSYSIISDLKHTSSLLFGLPCSASSPVIGLHSTLKFS